MNKYPRLRSHTQKGKNGQVWVWYSYDQRPNGPEISLGSDYAKALEQWELLHNKKPLTIGRVQEAIDRWRAEVLPTYENLESRKQYAKQLKRVEEWCGQKAWYDITLPAMRQYLKRRSAKTQGNREMSVLSILWGFAKMEGMTELP